MQAEILIVPTPASLEMLKSAAQMLAQTLVDQGIGVNEEISLCPDRKRLQHAISKGLNRSDLLFTLGGMGRESRFLAKQVMSEGLGLPLEHSRDCMLAIENYANRYGIRLSPDDVTLATLPTGSRPLLPGKGVIPGCMISSPSQHIVMLPEVEEEIFPMFQRQVLPLLSHAGATSESTHYLRTYGISEPQVQQMIADFMGSSNPVVTTYLDYDEVVIQVSGQGPTPADAAQMCTPVLRTIASRLGDYAYGLDVSSLEEAVVQKCMKKGLSLSVAESGSSGIFTERIVNFPQGEQVLRKSIIAEDNESKINRLGLNKKTLRRKGDVSEYTAIAMANGAREEGNSSLGVAICAHVPGFNQQEPAIVYLAVCDDVDVYVKKILVEPDAMLDYETVVQAAVARGLNMVRLFVDYHPESYHGSVSLERALAGKISVTDKETYDDNLIDDSYEEEPLPIKGKKAKAPKQKKEKKQKEPKKTKEEKSKKGLVMKIILFVAIAAFVFGAGYLVYYGINSLRARALQSNLSEVYDQTGVEGLHSLNKDTVGFVSLEGTEMRYPVVQSDDNDYYLRRDFNKKSNQHGVPFMDFRSKPKKPSDNMVIYGHNMRDGQIFGELLNYKDINYYREHPTLQFDGGLVGAGKADYKIFAIFLTSAEPSHFDDGEVFNYPAFVDARSKDEYNEYIQQVRARSIYNLPVDVKPGDKFITLSTCDYDLMNFRFVVMARKVRMGESNEVEVGAAENNQNPLYPDIWYRTYGGTKPQVSSWSYKPPLAPMSQGEKEGDKPASKEERPKPQSKQPEKKEESSSTNENLEAQKRAEEEKQAEALKQAEAQKQLEMQKQAELDAQKKAEEDKRKADEAKKAEEAAKKQAEETKKKEEADKSAAEATAISESNLARDAAKDAELAQSSTLNATNRKDADVFAGNAVAAANKAQNSANLSRQAANKAGTDKALRAATDAENFAAAAKLSAESAERTASLKEDKVSSLEENKELDGNQEQDGKKDNAQSGGSADTILTGGSGGRVDDDTLDMVARVVQNEMGPSFHPEAIKAQAVAAYTYIQHAKANGNSANISMASKADPKVVNLVDQVLGEAIYYNGSYAFTPYYATSSGTTASSVNVWGGSYPYLVSVDSSIDQNATGYQSSTTMSSDKVADLLSKKLDIDVSGDPSSWFQILSYEDGNYIGNVSICGVTTSPRGNKINGRMLRESVFGLRSAAFDIDYNPSSDSFTFTTYGYGHGVGMSQNGANLYAKQGWGYREILQHYYPGTSIQ